MSLWWGRKEEPLGDAVDNNNNNNNNNNNKTAVQVYNPTSPSTTNKTTNRPLGSSASTNSYDHPRTSTSVPSKKRQNRQGSTSNTSKSLTTRRRNSSGQLDLNNNSEQNKLLDDDDDDYQPQVAETHMGFEVSLEALLSSPSPLHKAGEAKQQQHLLRNNNINYNIGPIQTKLFIDDTTSPMARAIKPVILFQDEWQARATTHKAQFSVAQWPAIKQQHPPHRLLNQQSPLFLKASKNHRVKFVNDNEIDKISYDDAYFLLINYQVVDEITCVQEEIAHLNAELDALQKDKSRLQEFVASSSAAPQSPTTTTAPSQLFQNSANNNNSQRANNSWDMGELLASRNITAAQRAQLQAERGSNLTVFFHDRHATEALAHKCGIKPNIMAKFQESWKLASAQGTVPPLLELTQDNCRDGGAALQLQHISLLCKEGGTELSFFLGRDQGKSLYWGHLSDRLFRRMQDTGMNAKQQASELSYLATGPMDAYYAVFRSGEAWWGTAMEDETFHQICTEWNIYRVVFGPAIVLANVGGEWNYKSNLPSTNTPSLSSQQQQQQSQNSNNNSNNPQQQQQQQYQAATSWLILSRDGRVAWKNLPSRLHRLLQSRTANQSGIAEVSLGCGDSYFCRFLDGTIDYCLPSTLAMVCQQLEARGSSITNIALHPELSHDFVIRSTAEPL